MTAKDNRPVARDGDRPAAAEGRPNADVADFVAKVKGLAPSREGTGRGRLVFAMDATMSRAPTWDLALSVQSDMFGAVQELGGLDVQLVFFRGQAECRASRWVSDAGALARLMSGVRCHGGLTQIERVLKHVREETSGGRIHALVYVGDAMEENADRLAAAAGELGVLGVPAFVFQEGGDADAERVFREIARLTRGAWCRFDQGAAGQLRELLRAIAAYAAGGRTALLALAGRSKRNAARALLEQLGPATGQGAR